MDVSCLVSLLSVSGGRLTWFAIVWPAVWTLGNLGRVGYGGTLEGLWPYTYDTCDVGSKSCLNAFEKGPPTKDLRLLS